MELRAILFSICLVVNFNLYGQTRTISGRVIAEDLEILPRVSIQNSDTLILGTTDIDGDFKIEIPFETKKLLFGLVGMEWKSINLSDNCDHLDIILMYDGTYDFMLASRIDRLRTKRFKKLPAIHQLAYKRGVFLTEKPCYEFKFIPFKK
jgi:hypothetical protein